MGKYMIFNGDLYEKIESGVAIIEKLEQECHDGCRDCDFEHVAEGEMPCVECKQAYVDKYKRRKDF